MRDTNLCVSTGALAHWFNAIRSLDSARRTRALEGFWDTQLQSKAWLVHELDGINPQKSNVYVFGGWIGVLSSMLLDRCKWVDKVRSIDIDPECETVADTLCKPWEMAGWRFKAVTADMSEYEYQSDITPHIVINTSTEHVSQINYDRWYRAIPRGTIVAAQGNNFFSCAEHVRCSESIYHFMDANHVRDPLYLGQLPNSQYTRYMCIWTKT